MTTTTTRVVAVIIAVMTPLDFDMSKSKDPNPASFSCAERRIGRPASAVIASSRDGTVQLLSDWSAQWLETAYIFESELTTEYHVRGSDIAP